MYNFTIVIKEKKILNFIYCFYLNKFSRNKTSSNHMIILSLCIGEIPGEYTNTISETNYENIQNSFTIF